MGFLKEFGRYAVIYGEIALNKTEILAKTAKLKIELKKREMEIEKIKIETGEYVISQFEKNEKISDEVIKFKIDCISSVKIGMDELKMELESTKRKLWETAPDIKDEKKTD